MAYKDKDKQRETNRERQKRRRDKIKAEGVTDTGRDGQGVTDIKTTFNAGELSQCAEMRGMDDVSVKPKRGKDIKCFEDLHPRTQANIREISESNEEFKRRVAIAIHYQHLFPDRYEPRSDVEFTTLMATAGPGHVRVSKPGDPDYDGICTPERKASQA